MSEPAEDSVQRWTAKRRAALIVSILKGETSIAEAARKHGITVADVEDWHQRPSAPLFWQVGNSLYWTFA
jgi:transposase-like protein